jgi:hypothetical protein
MNSYSSNVKTSKPKKQNVVRYLTLGVLLPLLPFAFLLDLILFFIANYEGCLNCGYKEVINKGIFVRIVVKQIK